MEEEPWDELCGPPPGSSGGASRTNASHNEEEKVMLGVQRSLAAASPSPSVRRSKGPSAPPPLAAFSSPASSEKSWVRTDPPSYAGDDGSVHSNVSSSSRRSSSALPIEDEDVIVEDNRSPPSRSVSLPDGEDAPDPWESQEEESVRSLPNDNYQDRDAYTIRQEALMMLEVADDQLANSPYSVHRTASGGFMATHRALSQQGKQKRVPAALAGLKYTASRIGSGMKPYRDDPYTTMMAEGTVTMSDARQAYEYGDDDVVDVIAMQHRNKSYSSSGNRGDPDTSDDENYDTGNYDSTKSSSNRWSSRYSVDRTLLALAGGSTSSSNRRFTELDKMDAETNRERQAARNLFHNSETRNAGVFGGGYAFRAKHVFGKQGVTIKNPNDERNLRASLSVEEDDDADLPFGGRFKSWQMQFMQERRQRRILLVVSVLLFIFIVTLSATMANRSSQEAAATGSTSGSVVVDGTIPDGAITFYATSDVPYDDSDEDRLATDLQLISQDALFLVHLGNIQQAAVTLCSPSRYQDVANVFVENSPVTTFILPGAEDWPNCPDQDAAWSAWTRSFSYFEDQFKHDYEVGHQVGRKENFAVKHEGVFFAGIHIVDGRLYSEDERARRNGENYDWIKEMITVTAKDARAICIFGNARPGSVENQDFFGKMSSFLQKNGVPALYVHASSTGGGLEVYQPFEGADLVTVIQVAQGGLNPPVRISVGTDSTRPFVVG